MPLETRMTIKGVFLRALLYLGIALGSLAVLAVVVFMSVRFRLDIPVRWIGLAAFTVVIVWFIFRQYRMLVRNRLFWPSMLSVVGLHVVVYTALLIYIPDWRLGWFLPATFVEIAIIIVILEKVFHPSSH